MRSRRVRISLILVSALLEGGCADGGQQLSGGTNSRPDASAPDGASMQRAAEPSHVAPQVIRTLRPALPAPATVDSLVLAKQQARLLAFDGAAFDFLGTSTAVGGGTVVVGAPAKTVGSNAQQGVAYAFSQSGGWTTQTRLVAGDGAANDQFGSAAAANASTAIVGAPGGTVGTNVQQGAVYVYGQSGGGWAQLAKLTAADGSANDRFGTSLALDGDTLVVGATNKDVGTTPAQGVAYVFVQSAPGTWTQQARLVASDGAGHDVFGVRVAISGATIVVGANGKAVGTKADQGAAYVFARSGTSWVQQAKLFASDGGASDYFGASVAISGTNVLVGAYNHSIGANPYQGAAYVFARSALGTWSQQAKLVASDASSRDFFGSSVAISGTTALVGAEQVTVGINVSQGATYVFSQDATGAWTQQARFVGAAGGQLDNFGGSIALDGTTAVVGAAKVSFGPTTYQGAAYVFVPAHTNGDACAIANDCLSGLCVDGVCCDRGCNQQCEACDVAGALGTCTTVLGQPHGTRASCTGTGLGTACGQACNGIDATRCIYALATAACGANTCSGGTATHTGSCDYAGSCISATSTCDAYDCGTTACRTTCATSTDCAAGFRCAAPTCVPRDGLGKACTDATSCASGLFCTDGVCCGVADCGAGKSCALSSGLGVCKKKIGTACGASTECDSQLCVDGYCCNAPCTGPCEACDVSVALGLCVPVTDAPHGARPKCDPGTASERCSATTCDGTDRKACNGHVGSAVQCREAACVDGAQTLAAKCTGLGTCQEVQATHCAPYVCGATACLSACTTAADCVDGNRCDTATGKCVASGSCSSDFTTATSPTGEIVRCYPVLCIPSKGTCGETCLSAADCASPFVCDHGSCVNPPTEASGSGGCSAALPATSEGHGVGGFALVAFVLGVAARRRRSAQR